MRRYAIGLAAATFVLLVAGGLVSTTESGLACPDWPLCEGRYFPPMVDGKQFEHTHRLAASFVGAMTFGLLALVIKHRRQDKALIGLAAAGAALVVVQALLGALTVKLKLPPWVSSLHLATAMAFFCTAVTLAFWVHQRGPTATPSRRKASASAPPAWILAVGALTYLQVVGGAAMRHTRSGLACGFSFPLCLGKIWPLDGHLGIQLHMLHRAGGMLVGFSALALAVRLALRARRGSALWLCAVALGFGVVAQVVLGILTLTTSRSLPVMTVHSSLGALLLALLTSIYWLCRPSAPSREEQARGSLSSTPSLEAA